MERIAAILDEASDDVIAGVDRGGPGTAIDGHPGDLVPQEERHPAAQVLLGSEEIGVARTRGFDVDDDLASCQPVEGGLPR